ncbi:Rmd9 [Kluyveromyces lactis]|nr:Rmd9 [Kluyveromyces lactis]
MFRLVQQQTLKTRVPNQFVSASRNSLNSQFRFNSAVALERNPQQDPTTAAPAKSSSDKRNSKKKYENNEIIERNVKKVRNLRRNIKFDNFKNSPNSPAFNKLNALDDCLLRGLEASSSRAPDGKFLDQSSLFWDSVSSSMNIYRELVITGDLSSHRASRVIQLMHVALKVNRTQLTSMNKKPDYDSQSFHKEMTNYLCESLREISGDILANRVSVSEHGAAHLLSSFKELLLYEETLNIWKAAVNSENKDIVKSFMFPNVVGVVLPLLYENGTTFEEIKKLYEKSASNTTRSHGSPSLVLGMIKTSLAANENEHALSLFQEMCTSEGFGVSPYAVLTGTHLAFIGECKDLYVAKSFFERALSKDMPYKINLQVSSVKQLIQNIWDQTHDFNEVVDVWTKATKYYGKDVSHGISSSLNSKFISIFFENYVTDKAAGLQHLQELVTAYDEMKAIDEPFLNIILTKCTVWQDRNIIESIEKSYELYHIPKTIVTYRIILKAMGSISVSNDVIREKWVQLIQKADQIGQTYIANADWAALRDATVTYTQEQFKHGGSYEMTTSDSYNPALEAANASGAFDDFNEPTSGTKHADHLNTQTNKEDNDRILLYYQLVKRYGVYCRDPKQYARITSGIALNFEVAQPYLGLVNTMDVSSIYVPPLRNFHLNH